MKEYTEVKIHLKYQPPRKAAGDLSSLMQVHGQRLSGHTQWTVTSKIFPKLIFYWDGMVDRQGLCLGHG